APEGERLVLTPRAPVRADEMTLVQPQTGPRDRWLTRVAVAVNGRNPITVDLDERSRSTAGQSVSFPGQRVRRLEIEVLATNTGPVSDPKGADGVGFAEVRLDDVRVEETIRLPVDLLARAGTGSEENPLVLVLSRLRGDAGRSERQDEELSIARRFEIPTPRSFAVTGTARIAPNAPDATLDATLGTTASGATFSASTHLAGDAGARASRAFDGNPETAWTAAFGTQEGQWLAVDATTPVTFDRADLTIVADGRHSVPTTVRLEADGVPVRTLAVPPLVDGIAEGATQTVPLTFEPVTAGSLRLVVEATRPVTTIDDRTGAPVVLPVAIAEVFIAGLPVAPVAGEVSAACRDDLVSVDGDPVAVHVEADASAGGGAGLAFEGCDGPVDLGQGSHRTRTAPGLDTGLDVDRLVLRSEAGGGAGFDATPVVPRGDTGATVRVVDSGPTSFDLRVRTDRRPFWLVLGQSQSDGWEATTSDGVALGKPELVDGYANGWLVRPDRAGTIAIELRWSPQRVVWWGIGVSVLALVACAGVLAATRRRRWGPDDAAAVADAPTPASPFSLLGPSRSLRVVLASALGLGVVSALVSRPWIGVVVGVATLFAARVARGRVLLSAGAPIALAVAKGFDAPELGWLAVLLLLADLVLARGSAGGAGETEDALGDDVLVDLGGAAGDRV
ncbi:MAG TPA: discoidin domain-containing protein, partial [Acidimicrobiia bacterium]|nr:discoidin domain-containing protein [Acidimicrobiia bacterium]